LNNTPRKNGDYRMVRFTMSLTEEEANYIEQMRNWYQEEVGVKVSRNAVV
jgi:hypothetical protein